MLAVALLATGCASLPPESGRGMALSYTPRAGDGPAMAQPPREEPSRPLDSPPLALAQPEAQERLLRRRGSREAAVMGERHTQVRQAVLAAVDEVEGSTSSVATLLRRFAVRQPGLGGRGLSGVNGAFTRYLDYGANQLPWLRGALGRTTRLVDVAEEVGDSDVELGILRMTGPRLQAAMFGSMLLAAWLDFLTLADVVLRECPAYSGEKLIRDMERVQRLIEPTLAVLASGDPEQAEASALAMPELMGLLTREFGSIRDGARTSMENAGKTMAAGQLVELLTMVSAMRTSLPRLPPAAPATLGLGLVMGSGGVMAGSQVVVSAEWVEMIRRLVRAGVISIPAVSAAVRIHGGLMMSQANGDLPEGLRGALGDGPETRGMHQTGRAGAGMGESPKHHVLPREHRKWFEERGFTGDMNIDQFCVRLEQAHHQAIHGGGNWRLGRMWPGEWNRMIMEALREAEITAGGTLTRNEVLTIVAANMKRYYIPMNFTPWRGR